MKKAFVVIGVLAAVLLVVFAARQGFAFKVPGVPSSVEDVANAPKDVAFDACKAWADTHKENVAFNSVNIEKEMTKSKEITNKTTEKDYRTTDNKYDKENKNLELRATYSQFAELKLRCDKEKCSSINCNKK